jgi:hypothetical protein
VPTGPVIALRTYDAEPVNASPQGCPAGLIRGTLVADERWGIALRGEGNFTREVIWPHGFTARLEAGRVAVIHGNGSVVAREGDVVEIAGGETTSDGPWLECGGIRVVAQT